MKEQIKAPEKIQQSDEEIASLSDALPVTLDVVVWFLLYVLGYKASLQLVFSWSFRMIFSII